LVPCKTLAEENFCRRQRSTQFQKLLVTFALRKYGGSIAKKMREFRYEAKLLESLFQRAQAVIHEVDEWMEEGAPTRFRRFLFHHPRPTSSA